MYFVSLYLFLIDKETYGDASPRFFSMANTIQLFGLALLGGLAFGEAARRICNLPRTTGYVIFGLCVGQSGTGWIKPLHIESAQLFIDLALGVILFELGHLVPLHDRPASGRLLIHGAAIAGFCGAVLFTAFQLAGFSGSEALFAAALCLATSPAITIATFADVGARGRHSDTLLTLIAANGCTAFLLLALCTPLLGSSAMDIAQSALSSTLTVCYSLLIGSSCAAAVAFLGRHLRQQPELQHVLVLGCIVLAVGTTITLEISALLPMLLFGMLLRTFDPQRQVRALRIASDARIFLVIAFVLAGATLDIAYLAEYCSGALAIIALRLLAQWSATRLFARHIECTPAESNLLTLGMQPMSGVTLILVADAHLIYGGLPATLGGSILATFLLMQLLGPYCTQRAITGFGEATLLPSPPHPKAPSS